MGFAQCFKKNMEDLGLTAPTTLFVSVTAATATIGALAKAGAKYGTEVTLSEIAGATFTGTGTAGGSRMKPIRLFMLLVCTVCTGTAMAQTAPPPASFFSFDFPGSTNTQATAINVGGKIVGRYFSTDGVQHGFLLNGAHFESIDVPGATSTDVTWINVYDQISGSYTTSDGKTHGFLSSPGVFTTINKPGTGATFAFGIGDNDNVVGIDFDSKGALHGYLLQHGTFSSVTFPGATATLPTMVVGQSIVGGYSIGSASQGFLRSGGAYKSIGCPGDGNVFLSGMDPTGDMVGEVTPPHGNQHGLLIRNGKCILVDFPGGLNAFANGIANGNIVGRYTDASGNVHGFLAVGVGAAER